MYVHLLDSSWTLQHSFEVYDSLIWTERWNDMGDFELHVLSTPEHRTLLTPNRFLSIDESLRIMIIETVEDTEDEEGKPILKVYGRSLESVLENRIAKFSLSGTDLDPAWVINAAPRTVVNTMFDHIVRNAALNANDFIDYLQAGTYHPLGNIAASATSIRWEQKPDSLYNAIRAVCKQYNLGFRLVRRTPRNQFLHFEVYTGDNRRSTQSINAPLVFSKEFGNIQGSTLFTTIQNSKNVAHVFSPGGHSIVYAPGVSSGIHSYERRVMVVIANIPADHPSIAAERVRQGQEALRNNRAESIFDAEINQRDGLVYGTDYNLGDEVEFRNDAGVLERLRISEQIFASDAEGVRSYPSFTRAVV